ncbi:MAG: hypothetical protein U5K79_23240 [Cyclobacteriaceae bacterium]|nr:hypothetical protein [Cyclobacteriaceae bacterium]
MSTPSGCNGSQEELGSDVSVKAGAYVVGLDGEQHRSRSAIVFIGHYDLVIAGRHG